jgi:ectoine hydroxylase-related dioxygenase (phytanoyl-CoA dioxygenase family)
VNAEYNARGYIVLRGLFSPEEVAAWSAECERLLLANWVDPQNIRTPFRKDSGEFPERIDPVVDVSPLFAELVADPRLTRAVAQIFDDEARLFKDKIILKLPGTDGYTMHQDWAWGWQDLCPADDILSASIQIDGADPQNGGIELFSGYHHRLLTPPGLQSNFRAQELALVDPARGQKITTEPGDVLIFHSLTPHQSGRNLSPRPRRSLYLTYNAARAGDLRAQYYDNYRERVATAGHGAYFR